ncbi:hypothetical protein BJP25_22460 [Actinokineospora bangkokensis]|uniref:Uncharacterized protein n=1 Tax=Actinokineospora bangkokensis TaxID=1193682 RepID=A0A1Q9LJF6_9PSEU|nr:hypothetical protein BJP25_22460 [Actinokineospora bangkokensis]
MAAARRCMPPAFHSAWANRPTPRTPAYPRARASAGSPETTPANTATTSTSTGFTKPIARAALGPMPSGPCAQSRSTRTEAPASAMLAAATAMP